MVFGAWSVILTGAASSIVGSPGVIQAMRLKKLYDSKQAHLASLEAEVKRLEGHNERLDKNRYVQEREIRRTLGYAAADEIIFDFAAAERLDNPTP